jgi:membrane protease YdiL (CAAX protease family)
MPITPAEDGPKIAQTSVDALAKRSMFLAIAYVVVCVGLSWSFIWATTLGLPVHGYAFLVVLMWIPGTVSIAFRLRFREGFQDIGRCVGKLRYWSIAILVPLALATATYILAWLIGQVHITPYLKQQSMFGPMPFRLVWFNPDASTLSLLGQRLAMVLIFGIPLGFITGLGEEIVWRGYLLPRLIKAKARFPILISGVVWATWHMPFVLLTFQHQRYGTAALYWMVCVIVAVFIGWLRLASGSVFVAGMAHGAYNTFYQDFYDHSFAGDHKWFWAADVGLLCSVTFAAFALWLYKTGRVASALQKFRQHTEDSPRHVASSSVAGC